VTKKQMQDEIRYTLGLQDISAFDETAFIPVKLQQGTIDLLSRTKCVVRCVNLRTTAGEDTYILDSAVLGLVDLSDLPKARRDQTSYAPSFTLIRSDVLRLEPAPDTAGSVQVWAVLRPGLMAVDTDSPGDEAFGAIPDEYQDAIVTYALWKLADYGDDSSSQNGERYRQMYEGQDGRGGRILQIRQSVNRRGTAKGPQRRVRLPGLLDKASWVG